MSNLLIVWYKQSAHIFYDNVINNEPIAFPPLHDSCHCVIVTMPNGNQRWNLAPNACQMCKEQARQFNLREQQPTTLHQMIPNNPV